jgi:hypothetical protein
MAIEIALNFVAMIQLKNKTPSLKGELVLPLCIQKLVLEH